MICLLTTIVLSFHIHELGLQFESNRPHIVPITLDQSRITLQNWIHQIDPLNNPEHEDLILSYKSFCFNNSSDNIASFALMQDNQVKTVALLENVNQNIILWNLSVKPGEFQFGSDLIRLLHDILGKKFKISNTPTNQRWKIAHAYFKQNDVDQNNVNDDSENGYG